MLLNCWRRVHEDNQQKESNQSPFPSRWTRTPESRQGRAQDRPDVWYTDLRVGKRQGRGEETVIHPTPIFVNGYLTTPGQPAPEVWGMIDDLGFKIEVAYPQPVAK